MTDQNEAFAELEEKAQELARIEAEEKVKEAKAQLGYIRDEHVLLRQHLVWLGVQLPEETDATNRYIEVGGIRFQRESEKVIAVSLGKQSVTVRANIHYSKKDAVGIQLRRQAQLFQIIQDLRRNHEEDGAAALRSETLANLRAEQDREKRLIAAERKGREKVVQELFDKAIFITLQGGGLLPYDGTGYEDDVLSINIYNDSFAVSLVSGSLPISVVERGYDRSVRLYRPGQWEEYLDAIYTKLKSHFDAKEQAEEEAQQKEMEAFEAICFEPIEMTMKQVDAWAEVAVKTILNPPEPEASEVPPEEELPVGKTEEEKFREAVLFVFRYVRQLDDDEAMEY